MKWGNGMHEYKQSEFTTLSPTDNGDYVLYNSLAGLNSLCIVDRSALSSVTECFQKGCTATAENSIFETLIETGHLVSKIDNEIAKLNYMRSNLVNNPCLHLVIHTTQACNFSCQYCFLDHQPNRLSLPVQQEIISFIDKNIHRYSGLNISWFGGEPLLEMAAIERISLKAIEICRRNHKPFTAEITTNGYLLTSERLKKLISLSVLDYVITLDGLAGLHDSLRPTINHQGTFETIINNLLYLHNKIHSKAISVTMRSNLIKPSLSHLDDFYSYLSALFGDDTRFSLLIRPVSDWGGEKIKKIKESLLSADDMGDVYKKMSHKKMPLKFRGNIENLEFGGMTCTACWKNKYTIGVNGNISKCDNSTPVLTIGNLDNGRMIVNPYQEATWNNQIFLNDKSCMNCTLRGICFNGRCAKCVIHQEQSCCMTKSELEGLLQLAVYTMKEGIGTCRTLKK